MKCNDAVLLHPKTHPIEAKELIEKIKEELKMEKTELNKQSPALQPVTVPAFVVNEYNQLKLRISH